MRKNSFLNHINVTFSDGTIKRFVGGISISEAIQETNPSLFKTALAAILNGDWVPLSHHMETDAALRIVTVDDADGLPLFWHSTSHIMAQAVKKLHPEAQLGIGPAVSNGFYYDFRLSDPITVDEFPLLEKVMKEIVAANQPFMRQTMSKDDASDFFTKRNEPFKVELIKEIPAEQVTVYENDGFADLCRGPHVPSTGFLKHFKLLSVAGAYWRGDERNAVMQRIYGVSFPKRDALEQHLHMLEEAQKRDHRRLGKELDLFSFQAEGPGFPFWHPNGVLLVNAVTQAVRDILDRNGYQEIKTPIILNEDLWHRSGHWDHYKENMYFTTIDEQPYAVKPMNCPGCLLVYRNAPHSYKDLPLKYAEMGLVHRHEKSGVLHGLFRVRQFTQDDAHVFCMPDQIQQEVAKLIDLVEEVYRLFEFREVHLELSTRPLKSIGSAEMWKMAESALTQALQAKGKTFQVNPGEGAFYGPKIDYHIQDTLGRMWQCGTIQVDFSMPERFGLEYVGADGGKHRPVMIHRAILGSVERFIGILIEHFGGAFPIWLAPEQLIIVPISEKHHAYARDIETRMKSAGIRCSVDTRNEKMGYKIRQAEKRKVPYMGVVGDKEAECQTMALRKRHEGDLGSMSVSEALAKIQDEITRRTNH
jgi:threonyl-tRNA synthetase